MGIEAQNTLYALAKLGLVETREKKGLKTYTFEYLDGGDFIPKLEDLKYLETLCSPYYMRVDCRNRQVIMEFKI